MSLHTRETGSGPAVLLLHGTPSSVAGFAALAQRLAPRHRVLVPDLPGYGMSPPLEGGHSYERVTALLEETLLQRGLESAAVVGFSGGGYLALLLALSTRVSISTVFLLGTTAGYPEEARAQMREHARLIRERPEMLGTAEMRAAMADRMLAPAFAAAHAEAVEEVGDWLSLTTPDALAAELDAFANTSGLELRLGDVRARVVARVGELDVACPVALSRDLVDRVPIGELQVVNGCGHALLIEDGEATCVAIEAALDRC
jgi:3-oxoadipate enol-lactonase